MPRPIAPVGDEPAVRRLLTEFRSAYGRLDAPAAKELWPDVDEHALSKAFANLESQDIAFDNCRIHVGSATALAYCSGTATYVGRLGSHPQTKHLQWTFSLDKQPAGWQIRTVQIR